jgi:hypothetical protein
MKNIILTLVIVLFAVGCSKRIQTDANGTPQFTLAAEDLASPIEIVTNGVFEVSQPGAGTVEFTTKNMPGMTGLRFKLTAAKLHELGKFRHYVAIRSMDRQPNHARAQILVGSKVVYDSPDFRVFVWSAAGGMALSFKSPDEAQSVADSLTRR